MTRNRFHIERAALVLKPGHPRSEEVFLRVRDLLLDRGVEVGCDAARDYPDTGGLRALPRLRPRLKPPPRRHDRRRAPPRARCN